MSRPMIVTRSDISRRGTRWRARLDLGQDDLAGGQHLLALVRVERLERVGPDRSRDGSRSQPSATGPSAKKA